MGKTLLHKLFGAGRIPRRVRPTLEAEEIAILDEGIGGSITFRDFSAPGRWYGLRRIWFTGAAAATRKRIVGFAYNRNILNFAFDHPRFSNIRIAVEPGPVLCIAIEAADFNPDQSGRIEFRFSTEKASEFVARCTAA